MTNNNHFISIEIVPHHASDDESISQAVIEKCISITTKEVTRLLSM